jgi:hypothetical protein
LSNFVANSPAFGFDNISLIHSSSAADRTTTPLFFVDEPEASTGLISIAIESGLPLKPGSLSRNRPGMLVAFFSQSLASFRNRSNLLSTDIVI